MKRTSCVDEIPASLSVGVAFTSTPGFNFTDAWGIGYLPGDAMKGGLMLDHALAENIFRFSSTSAVLSRFSY